MIHKLNQEARETGSPLQVTEDGKLNITNYKGKAYEVNPQKLQNDVQGALNGNTDKTMEVV